MNRPSGELRGLNAEEIADEAMWEGDPQEFVRVLCEVGLLDRCEEGIYSLHDWHDHNAYAAHHEVRSIAGKKAAEARWSKRGKSQDDQQCDDADSCDGQCEKMRTHKSAMRKNANAQKGNAPIPIPTPIPSHNISCADLAHEQAHAPDDAHGPEDEQPAPSPKPADSPPVYSLPCNGTKKIYHVTAQTHVKLVAAYPGVDVMAEYAKMDAWLETNSTKRKTHGGMGKFINSWLGRAQNDARGQPQQSQPALFAGPPEPQSVSNEVCQRLYGY